MTPDTSSSRCTVAYHSHRIQASLLSQRWSALALTQVSPLSNFPPPPPPPLSFLIHPPFPQLLPSFLLPSFLLPSFLPFSIAVRITKQPIPVEWCIGSKVSLVCEAKSLPNRGDMVYNWLKSTTEDGRQRSFITSQPPRVTLKDGVLSFDPISQKDWGYYMCQPANDEHFINSCSVKVIAVPPPGQTQGGRATEDYKLTGATLTVHG